MNLFDGLQRAAQNVVTNAMGYDALWTPSTGGETLTARVLFNKPTQKENVSDDDYLAIRPRMEYFSGDFPGLLDSVRDNNNEMVIISDISYVAFRGEMKFDGKTIIIYLEQQQ
ncbi:head-tail joining protein [Pinibacter soli]|uniref:Uncharacterized protein n=1 Tax=Pinibacter soli TaxID=3044211 RepID=A0ABT6RC66_9BACT|nr:hypothetical protein [Pinibacter soli]MDI3319986.1 hypothetical protein [Pinibacter soli]